MKFFCTALLLSILCIPFFLSASQAYNKTETQAFTFFYSQADKKAALILARNADMIVQHVANTMGFDLKEKVKVVISPNYKEFQKAQPEGTRVPSWAVGVAYPSKNLIVLLKKERVDLIKTFRHEVNHILLGQAFKGKNRVPRWLDEGLAMITANEWSLSRLSTITFAVLTDSLIPMDNIAKYFPADLKYAELAYCQSFYFISFLKGKFGSTAFKNFLKEYSKQKNFYRAIRKTYHISWDKMEDLWLDYLRLRFSWIPILTSAGAIWFFASLIFIIGYIKKKRESLIKMQQWEVEENFLYGDDNDE